MSALKSLYEPLKSNVISPSFNVLSDSGNGMVLLFLGTKSLYTLRNYKKNYLYINKDKNKKKTIRGDERKRSKEKEKDLISVKALDKYQKIYNEIRYNSKNKNN